MADRYVNHLGCLFNMQSRSPGDFYTNKIVRRWGLFPLHWQQSLVSYHKVFQIHWPFSLSKDPFVVITSWGGYEPYHFFTLCEVETLYLSKRCSFPSFKRVATTFILASQYLVHWLSLTKDQPRNEKIWYSSATRCCVSGGRWCSLSDPLFLVYNLVGVSSSQLLYSTHTLTRDIL